MSNAMSTLQSVCLDAQASSPYSSLCSKKIEGEEAGRSGQEMVTPKHGAACCLLSRTV